MLLPGTLLLSDEARRAQVLRVLITGGGCRFDDLPLAWNLAHEVLQLPLPASRVEFTVTGPHGSTLPEDLTSKLARVEDRRAYFEVQADEQVSSLLIRLLEQIFPQHILFFWGLRTPTRYREAWQAAKRHVAAGGLVLLGEAYDDTKRGCRPFVEQALLKLPDRYEVYTATGHGGDWYVACSRGRAA